MELAVLMTLPQANLDQIFLYIMVTRLRSELTIKINKLFTDCCFAYAGHSCLVPITETCTKTLYVFVEIQIDVIHWLNTVRLNFPNKENQ